MADLIAIGYPDEATGALAEQEAQRLAKELIIQSDAIASVRRDREGKFHVSTSHNPVGAGATWGMFWGLLFGLLFFIPVFGMAVGAGLGALFGHSRSPRSTRSSSSRCVTWCSPAHRRCSW